ncbi:hypothetical protein SAMN02745196_00958 [Clostridium collagenovorans DSM 3089]|uniref:YdbS-like PH domain-containing protein n=1 Tax=Clostridium collagenovorans DSM 3089 TaxID=1121306 RepID=A0A1M5UVG8_9CLOT|nr:PH domain-containing protein [Clostridium collagenovorans]SHH66971.1 hypothetical protein SAMN02745196_00958 [Clostridium collagenovorans DSM 3089]
MNYKNLETSTRWSWFISRLILLLILGGILIGIKISLGKIIPDFNWLINLIVIVSLVLLSLNALIYPFFEYKQWKYMITEDKIEIVHGLFFVTTTIIPILRIQHVSISQGPINKLFNLNNITINTAGGAHNITGLTLEDANKISEYLNARIISKVKNKLATTEAKGV